MIHGCRSRKEPPITHHPPHPRQFGVVPPPPVGMHLRFLRSLLSATAASFTRMARYLHPPLILPQRPSLLCDPFADVEEDPSLLPRILSDWTARNTMLPSCQTAVRDIPSTTTLRSTMIPWVVGRNTATVSSHGGKWCTGSSAPLRNNKTLVNRPLAELICLNTKVRPPMA